MAVAVDLGDYLTYRIDAAAGYVDVERTPGRVEQRLELATLTRRR